MASPTSSGWYSTLVTFFVCPSNIDTTWPVSLLNTVTFLSFPPVTIFDVSRRHTSTANIPGTLALCNTWNSFDHNLLLRNITRHIFECTMCIAISFGVWSKLTVCDACCLNALICSDVARPSGIVLPLFFRSAVSNVALSCSCNNESVVDKYNCNNRS